MGKLLVWLKQKLLKYTPNVIVQEAPTTTYDGKNHTLKNIIVSFSPDKKNRALFYLPIGTVGIKLTMIQKTKIVQY